jgi:hypothetical protein
MSTIAILSLSAVIVTGLALIHETRLRRIARRMLCRSVRLLRRDNALKDQTRGGKG